MITGPKLWCHTKRGRSASGRSASFLFSNGERKSSAILTCIIELLYYFVPTAVLKKECAGYVTDERQL